MDVILIHPTPDGTEEISLDGESLSFGRGSEADYRFEDDGLSRLHATIYRDDDNLWIVDENSTNGTFVNGESVPERGTPLESGDTIRIGNYTELKVRFRESRSVSAGSPAAAAQTQSVAASSSSSAPKSLSSLLPIAIIGIAFFVISISAAFIIIKSLAKEETVISQHNNDDDEPTDDNSNQDEKPNKTKTPKPNDSPSNLPPGDDNSNPTPPDVPQTPTPTPLPPGKKYLELSEDEKTKYVESRLKKIASIVGNRSSEAIPPLAVARIQKDVTGYAKRITSNADGKACPSSLKSLDGLQATFERASKNTWFISRAFSQQGIEPQVGIYVAMIESEHCACVKSPTGPLGMFQFTRDTAKSFFENPDLVVSGASPANPDVRCQPEPAARAGAKYVKYLTGWYGTGPASLPLAIAAYNSGEGMMRKNLKTALDADPSLSRDFWTLIANSDKLTEQFRTENFMYPPKFFAAAIVGENPQDFGLNLQPLSTYTSK
jgi:pSer/pThr/pTyr-binding forkhead associated (FHA) protein